MERRRLSVAVLVVVLGCTGFWISRQRVTALNSHARVQQTECRLASSVRISTGCLVLLDVDEFGYCAYVQVGADEPSYDGFFAKKGVLSRGEADNKKLLAISAPTKAAVNLSKSSSALNAGPHPLLIDRLPWPHATRGVPTGTDYDSMYPWLRHRFSVTGIANDGTVTIAAGGKRVLLKPGGEVKIERSMGVWRSTVIIRHKGIYDKGKITQSKWLRVE